MQLSVSFYLSSALGEVLTSVQMFGNDPGSSPYCEKTITITCNGKTTNAIIDDKVNFLCHPIYQLLALFLYSQCPGCPPGGLDMTQGLFQFFAPISDGVIYGSWEVAGDAPAQAPTTSSTPPPPPPSTTYVPPTTSQQSTYSPPPPSSSSSSTTTSTTSKISSSVSSAAPSTSHQSSFTSSATQTSSGVNYNNAPASSLAQPSGTITPGQDSSIDTVYQAMIGLGTIVMAFHQ